jgi:hypothetical protein
MSTTISTIIRRAITVEEHESEEGEKLGHGIARKENTTRRGVA